MQACVFVHNIQCTCTYTVYHMNTFWHENTLLTVANCDGVISLSPLKKPCSTSTRREAASFF